MVDLVHNLESSTSGSKEYLCPHPTMLPLDIFIGQRRKLEDGVTLVGDQPSDSSWLSEWSIGHSSYARNFKKHTRSLIFNMF